MKNPPLRKLTVDNLRVIPGGRASQIRMREAPPTKVALVLHADASKREAISAGISHAYRAIEAQSMSDAEDYLSFDEIDYVVADASFCGKPVLDGIARAGLSGRCVFVSSPESVNRLMDGFSRGHAFGIVYDSGNAQDLKEQVAALVNPRNSGRHSVSEMTLEADTDAGPLESPVLDLSNRGFALWISARAGARPLYPGAVLSNIILRRNGSAMLKGGNATARYLEAAPSEAGEMGFRVGCEFVQTARPSSRPIEQTLIQDPVVIAASLKAVLKAENPGIYLNIPGFDEERVHATKGFFDFDASLVTLEIASNPGWDPGDVCRAVFELGGTQHVFWSSVLYVEELESTTSLTLTMPKSLSTRRSRHTQRFQPPASQAVKLTITSPFGESPFSTSAIDITASGTSFEIDAESQLFPIGSVIPQLTLRFPYGAELTVCAQVRSLCKARSNASSTLKCGVEFITLQPVERAALADYVVRCVRPEVSSGLDSSFGDIWSFLKDSGFLYPEKLKHLDETEIQRSMSRLLDRPNDVFKTWLCKSEDEITAHISAVRLFDSTWGVQHLAASAHREGVSRARLLNMALTEYCEQHPEIEWVRICYRPNNTWPARVFGAYAQKMVDRELSELRTLSYLVGPTSVDSDGPSSPEISVRPFVQDDLTAIEAYFISNRQTIRVRSTDISAKGIGLEGLDASYQRLGLFRRREVLVAERRGDLVGFVLAEVSSPGLNLSELTNTASIHLVEDDPSVLRALALETRALYRSLGRPECILLVDDEMVPTLLDYGFHKQKEYCVWTWHRSLWRRFYEHSVRAFG